MDSFKKLFFKNSSEENSPYDENYCVICIKTVDSSYIVKLSCNHKFCYDCILRLKHKTCPTCRKEIGDKTIDSKGEIIVNERNLTFYEAAELLEKNVYLSILTKFFKVFFYVSGVLFFLVCSYFLFDEILS